MNVQNGAELTDGSATERRIVAWIEHNVGGKVSSVRRQERWRPAWFIELDHPEGVKHIYVRGERSSKSVSFPLEHEANVLRVLEKHDIPVPHVYGICPEPLAIIMDKAPGRADLSTAVSEEERCAVLDEMVEIMAKMHSIDASEFESIGLEHPAKSRPQVNILFDLYDYRYRESKIRPEPVLEFMIGWVKRNVPTMRHKVCLVWGDPAQFLFENGRVTAFLDFEFAFLGDPLHDVAGLPIRDTNEPLGDVHRAIKHYIDVTGEQISPREFNYFVVQWALCTPLALFSTVTAPLAMGAMLQYMEWFVHFCRYPMELIAHEAGIKLSPLVLPKFGGSRSSTMAESLVGAVRALPVATDYGVFEQGLTAKLAEYMHRVIEYGPALQQQDSTEIEGLLGVKFDDWIDADLALEQLAQKPTADQDAVLIPLLYRRIQRQAWLLEPLLSRPEAARPAQPFEAIMSKEAFA